MKTLRKSTLLITLIMLIFAGCKSESKKNEKAAPPKKTKRMKAFTGGVIHKIQLNFDSDNFYGTLVEHKTIRDSIQETNYIPAKVTFNDSLIGTIGVRIKGESSYDFYPGKKKSLKLKFNESDSTLNYFSYKKMNLNNNFKDPTMLREKLFVYAMKKLGLPYQKSAFANLRINNKDWGLYLMLEQIDKRYLKRNFGNKNGVLYKGVPKGYLTPIEKQHHFHRNYHIKSNKSEGFGQLQKLITVLNNTSSDDSTYYKKLIQVFNLDDCLKTWALNNALVNIDAYNMYYPHNYYLYHNTETDKMEWINYDANYAFGTWTPKFTLEQLVTFDPLYVNEDAKQASVMTYLFRKNSIVKNRYLELYTNEVLPLISSENFLNKIKEYEDLIEASVKSDPIKMFSYDEFKTNIRYHKGDVKDPGAFIPGLHQFLKERTSYLNKALDTTKNRE